MRTSCGECSATLQGGVPLFKRIIIALRFNKVGEAALEKGVQLAREHGARLQIFHALDYRLLHPGAPSEEILSLTESAQHRFKSTLKPLLGDFDNFAFNCWEGDPPCEICRLAIAVNADLVIIGCHQAPHGKSVYRIGNIGMAILESVPCPILLVPCPDKPEGANGLEA